MKNKCNRASPVTSHPDREWVLDVQRISEKIQVTSNLALHGNGRERYIHALRGRAHFPPMVNFALRIVEEGQR